LPECGVCRVTDDGEFKKGVNAIAERSDKASTVWLAQKRMYMDVKRWKRLRMYCGEKKGKEGRKQWESRESESDRA
jgi:hypothetical protein